MKILLPVRNGAENSELLYALRSWEANLMFDLELTVVGDELPTWLNADQLVLGNQYENSQMNVFHNIRVGCEALADEDEIIIMNDDFFVLDPVPTIVPTYRSTLIQHLAKARGGSWWGESLRSTLLYLREKGIDSPMSYELHRPCVVRPAQMAEVLSDAAEFAPENPPQWRTLYGNLATHWSAAVQARDAKSLRANVIPIGVPFVSTDDMKWRQYWSRVLVPLLDQPSRWESSLPNQERKS